MTCPKCGYTYADALSACPHCGQTENARPSHNSLQAMFDSNLFCCVCVIMSITTLLYWCSGRLGLFWICLSVAGWITYSGKASQKRLEAGLKTYSVILKIMHITMLTLAALFALLAAAILIVGSFSGDTWLTYLAGVSTEYGTGMIPVAAFGRLFGAVISFGGMAAVGSAAIALVAIAAVVFFMAKLLIPIRRYVYGLHMSLAGKPVSHQASRTDISLIILGAIQGLYALTYINQDSIIGLIASIFAAVSLFMLAWLIRE